RSRNVTGVQTCALPIWEMHHGKIPEGMEIDHINGIRDDNRIDNLRLVTSRTNDTNRAKSKANTSGVVGVCWDKRKGLWLVRIYEIGRASCRGKVGRATW